MLDSGVIEKVPLEEIECSRPKFYMPHRPVVREDKLMTKVRPVFDASAKDYNQVSLNDCMEAGPCLVSNLTEILVRFRRWPVTATADIEKEDRDVHRFLWQPDDDVMIMRFTRVKGELSFVELEKAKMVLIQQIQCGDFPKECASLQDGRPVKKSSALYKFQPFLDGEGIMRVGGRLQYSDLSYDSKHPILIPKSHLAVLLVRFQHQLLKHGGVDVLLTSLGNQFWIVGARALAKQVKKWCLLCQKQDAVASSQLAAPLPTVHVRPAEPFAVTGVDRAGPLYCCDQPGKKLYMLLFTCGVVRAVHLELVSFLSSPETLMAFRRFVARPGVPHYVFSDNAKGFKAMPDLLMRQFEHVSPEWTWIVPDSPWWGGWCERLVRSVKTALWKSVGVNSLTHTELLTVLVEIEACINSRPLTFVWDDIETREPLRPAHFLLWSQWGLLQSSLWGNLSWPWEFGSEMAALPEYSSAVLVRMVDGIYS